MPAQQFTAKHRSAAGKPLVQVTTPTYYDLDTAATALAQVFPEIPSKFGRRSAQRGLMEAAQRGITGRRQDQDPEAVRRYRSELVELGVFPDPEAPDQG